LLAVRDEGYQPQQSPLFGRTEGALVELVKASLEY